jgi:hypothetical protein
MSPNKVVDENHLPGIISAIESLRGYEVEAGIFGANATKYVPVSDRGEGQQSTINMLELAQILHEGCRIRVTKKMRGWFGHRGIHLKASTTEIVIPARPWIDAANDKAAPVVMKIIERAIDNAIDKQKSEGRAAWERVGLEVVGLIKKEMVDLRDPPNSQLTIKWKGSENPLIDHGHLLRSNVHEVRRR